MFDSKYEGLERDIKNLKYQVSELQIKVDNLTTQIKYPYKFERGDNVKINETIFTGFICERVNSISGNVYSVIVNKQKIRYCEDYLVKKTTHKR